MQLPLSMATLYAVVTLKLLPIRDFVTSICEFTAYLPENDEAILSTRHQPVHP